MLVMTEIDTYHNLPDDIAVLILSDPTHGDVEDFTAQEVNMLIHVGLAVFWEEGLSLDENINHIANEFDSIEPSTEENKAMARKLIKKYNDNIVISNIGRGDFDEVFQDASEQQPLIESEIKKL